MSAGIPHSSEGNPSLSLSALENGLNQAEPLNRFTQATKVKISSALETLPQRAPDKADVIKDEFIEFARYLGSRSAALKKMYPKLSADDIQPQEYVESQSVKIEDGMLQEHLRTPFMISVTKSYFFSRDHNLPNMSYSRESILKKYPHLIEDYDKMAAMNDSDYLEAKGGELTVRLQQILEASHNRSQRIQAGFRNQENLEGAIIQPGDLLHGGSSEKLEDILVNGLWCPELREARWAPMGANHLSIACGEATGSINIEQLSRHIKEVNPLIFTTLYPRGEQRNNNDSFFVQYSGNMAALYGPIETDLTKLRAIPENMTIGIDDRKVADKRNGVTFILRPQQEKFKGMGDTVEYTSTEVDIPFGIPATDIKGIVVNGMNETETRKVLRMVAANDFFIPIYDCTTGDILN